MLALLGYSSIKEPTQPAYPGRHPYKLAPILPQASGSLGWKAIPPPTQRWLCPTIPSKQSQSGPVSPIQSSSHPTTPERWLWRDQCQQVLGLVASKTRGYPAHQCAHKSHCPNTTEEHMQ